MPHLHIVLTDAEQMHLKQQAGLCGLSVSSYTRKLIMGKKLKPKPPEGWTEILRQLTGIGTNINQIARIANASGHVRQEDIERIKEMQNQIWTLVKAL